MIKGGRGMIKKNWEGGGGYNVGVIMWDGGIMWVCGWGGRGMGGGGDGVRGGYNMLKKLGGGSGGGRGLGAGNNGGGCGNLLDGGGGVKGGYNVGRGLSSGNQLVDGPTDRQTDRQTDRPT
ncbi:hypothetical protein DPMN_026781 [Dreissena polymorpha]|uniref:Uncharacterized protein n=1 Tax=Dreissena polymorpha TaxID=45954 RepID=A0A9D4LTL1_DREPO|nr:hypothetical protein DPMN_026781 [Dreissena polymorpha]